MKDTIDLQGSVTLHTHRLRLHALVKPGETFSCACGIAAVVAGLDYAAGFLPVLVIAIQGRALAEISQQLILNPSSRQGQIRTISVPAGAKTKD